MQPLLFLDLLKNSKCFNKIKHDRHWQSGFVINIKVKIPADLLVQIFIVGIYQSNGINRADHPIQN